MAKRRRRGVVLTPEGLEKFQAARLKHEAEENYGERYTYEKLSELTYLDIHTIKRVIECQEGVDKRTLERIFISFELDLDENCYTKPNPHRRQHWGEAMCVADFYGRKEELKTLETWLLKERCRVITLLGMGGMGKTCLSVKLAKEIQERFDMVMWCSLRDAPSATDVVTRIVEFLSDGKDTALELPESFAGKVNKLIEYLRNSRCLILLDNLESLLCDAKRAGIFREGFEDYGDLLLRLGETEHISSVIVTTREKPKEIAHLEGEDLPVRTFRLYGLEEEAGEQILKQKKLQGSNTDYSSLIDYYGGNALALKVVATTIKEIFQGDITEFLNQETAVFGDIRDLLAQQFNRLTPLEREIMYWLAINREPLTIEELRDDLVSKVPRLKLLEALESLSRRSLVERDQSSFTLQNVVMEYAICRFLELVCDELIKLELELFRYHAIIKATAKDYVRETQIRLILQPLLEQLEAHYKSQNNVTKQLNKTLAFLRENHAAEDSYAGGNLINMLCHLKADFTGYDFSNLAIWQADFRNSCFHDVNLAHSNLSKSVFAEAFGGIISIAFSPNGEILATGDTNGDIRLRKVADGQQILSWKGHANWVSSIAFSADGNFIASGSTDHNVKLWDINKGQCIQVIQEHDNEVWSVAFSPDGTLLASASDDGTIKLTKIDTEECFKTFYGHSSWVCSVVFNPDGKTIVSSSDDKTIKVWDLRTGECLKTLQGHADGIRSIVFASDGYTLLSGSEDHTVKVWDIVTGTCLNTLYGHSNEVYSVASSPCGNFIASASFDLTVRLWRVDDGKCIKIFPGHTSWLFSVAFHPDGKFLASGSYDQTLRIWSLNDGKCLKMFQGYTNQAYSVAFDPDGRTVLSGGHDCSVRLWDLKTGQCLKKLQGHQAALQSVDFNPNGQTVISGSHDCSVRLWDLKTGKCLKKLQGHQAMIRSVAYSPGGQTVVSGSYDHLVMLWDIKTGQCMKIFDGHKGAVWCVTYSPDGQTVVSGGLDQTIKFWDIKTGKCIKTLENYGAWVWSTKFSPNGKLLASASPDGAIRLWNTKTGECIKVLRENMAWLSSVAFSPDSRILASGSHDHKVRLWDIKTGECLKILSGHKGGIWAVTFNSKQSILASGSDDETIKIWNLANGECIKTLQAEKPYESLNIESAIGLTTETITTLEILGAKTL